MIIIKTVINTYLCCVTGQKFDAERTNTEYIKLQYKKKNTQDVAASQFISNHCETFNNSDLV